MGWTVGAHPGGRPRSYKTPAALQRKVNAYFESISVGKKLTEWVPTGELTQKGRPILEERDVLDREGQPIWALRYIVPPRITALCIYLGISRRTWELYASDEEHYPGYGEVCEDARLRIEDYLAQESLTREKGLQGVLFNLQANYGWRERRELELGHETRRAISTEHMTMAEKLALIREAAEEQDEDGDS